MIRAIIFDYGNVICRVDNYLFLERIYKYCNKPVSELHKLIYQDSGLPDLYESGLISSDDFYYKISELCGLKIKRSEFKHAFTNIFTPIRDTINLIRQLKPHYKLALVSNTNEWDFEYEIKKNEVFQLFDTVTVSFVVKEMKPGKKMYMDALSKLNLDPEECIYIDDIKEYVDAANKLGIRGVHYTSHGQLVDSLKKLAISI